MSNKQLITKKLKAIVFTDIVDFTSLSAKDEYHALELIDKQREIVKPIVEEFNGEWLKEIGDGLLFSFDSSLDAVKCSIKIQEQLKNEDELKVRIGIHQGDVLIEGGDVFGDDVNIASRVEGFSPVGGISISDKVYKDISGVKEIKTSFIGHRKLKGVEQETQIRCITSNNLPKIKSSKLVIAIGVCAIILSLLQMANMFIIFNHMERFNAGDTLAIFDVFQAVTGVVHGLIIFIAGYNCFAYVRGLSIKVQKYMITATGILVISCFLIPMPAAMIWGGTIGFKMAVAQADVQRIGEAVILYKNDNSHYPPDCYQTLIDKEYINKSDISIAFTDEFKVECNYPKGENLENDAYVTLIDSNTDFVYYEYNTSTNKWSETKPMMEIDMRHVFIVDGEPVSAHRNSSE